jgi:hypothetical protein
MIENSSSAETELRRLAQAVAEEPARALSSLTAHAKKQAARETIDRLFADRSPVYAALQSADPKARKNAARLLGALGRPSDAAALSQALQTEITLFVVPSILLALGSAGGSSAETALAHYEAAASRDETEQKHILEIRRALEKARAALERDKPLPPREKLSRPADVLLTAPEGFAETLQKELAANGLAATPCPGGALLHTNNLKPLYTARCAAEVLLPVAKSLPADAKRIASAAVELLERPYRVELRGYAGDRAAFIRAVSDALGGGDNPSRYADELRVVCRGNACDVFIRPCSVPDTRFAYRKKSLPASIHPATAACLARYALSFVSAGRVRALDPFCGSGTLLFELEHAAENTALIGVDISEHALESARINARAAKSSARFIRKDILKFTPHEPFDLVLTNMPFGNRVGTHASNEPLYRGFVRMLPYLLSEGGAAALYTMEHRLLHNCLRREARLTVVSETRTEAGGLNPRITVVKWK